MFREIRSSEKLEILKNEKKKPGYMSIKPEGKEMSIKELNEAVMMEFMRMAQEH